MAKTGSEIRESFLQYFTGKGHTVVASSALIPKDDPTLMFTNSGMVQFKNAFLGLENRGYTRAASSQKCVRAGGKHNDLENVGVTARHHTFFEMLGNFSFGDYFKKEAIAWGWEYLTEVVQLPKDKLWVTVYQDDDEAYNIWHKKMKVPADRIVRMGEKSNFWMMGDTGPCGPCSEVIYDQGAGVGCGRPECDLDCGCDRYLEIWNLVFTQFDRDATGKLTPLPKPNIDTGMGLERLTAVIQGAKSNYDTDLFGGIIRFVEKISGKTYGNNADDDTSIRVIADHSRAVTFLIGDGILPSNEGRGYVLRRILRRAARHGKMLGINKPFLYQCAEVVIAMMKDVYSDLESKSSFITKVIINEEQRFMETLDAGLRILQEETAALKKAGKSVLPGALIFKLYDTFGFPTDLTADIVRHDGLTLDNDGFETEMEQQRERARGAWKGSGEESIDECYLKASSSGIVTNFCGYEGVTKAESKILAIFLEGKTVESLVEGQIAELIVETTPFYGESGGQVGDTGYLEGKDFVFEVQDTKKPVEKLFVHKGVVQKGNIKTGDKVHLIVDLERRKAIAANHSGTHLLQAALKAVLGDHIKQSGSLVNTERLRFDFSHFSKITDEELSRIEDIANDLIRKNIAVVTEVCALEDALKTGATAVFDEKYGATVRIVKMGEMSMELCGGTHVLRTGDIGLLKVLHESAIAAGVRRIEAVTGRQALLHVQKAEEELKKAALLFKTSPSELTDRAEKLLKHSKDMEKEIEALKGKLAAKDSGDLLSQAKEIGGIKVLATEVSISDAKTLRDFGDKLRDKLASGIILLGSKAGEKAFLLCMVTKDLTGKYSAGSIIKELAPLVGGSGGGRPDMAQAGGTKPENLGKAIAALEKLLTK
ncbi:MAG: alanine--tRNA ligase [Deltaproteobacteria bacterium HGW-Deltaproteobacteria-12]|jgi:alanyl-tRNA synthetase|nr:MAG: alanine--tRNA ligase [Deltaproteobacteria bacterium HGW-Deltaproteobacteria-12]